MSKQLKVFISWSGDRSLALATEIRSWLKIVVHSIEPWFSGRDISPGQRWNNTLGKELEESDFGVICVTPENVDSPWLLFESGALGKSFSCSKVVPLLLGLQMSDLRGPLSQFQALSVNKEGMRTLVEELHKESKTNIADSELSELFEALWPKLEKKLAAISVAEYSEVESSNVSERKLLEEILDEVRGIRLTPDEDTILKAIHTLSAQTKTEIEYLREKERILTEQNAPISLDDRAIAPAEEKLKRLDDASRTIKYGDHNAMAAAAVEVKWFGDLEKTVRLLREDLDSREYRLELRGDRSSSLYSQIQSELKLVTKLEQYIRKISAETETKS